jgi:NADPH2:quinone reductase
MKGIQIDKTGGVEVLNYRTDLPVPTPKEGEILVKNDFVGINYIDTYVCPIILLSGPNSLALHHSYDRRGLLPSPTPQILGREGEGIVVATGPGELNNIKVGDRVVYMGSAAYAEYTATPSVKAYVVPPTLGSGVAAAALLQGLTALTLIREAHVVQKGDWVLVHAAAGGVGLWLCQLLQAVGARTIGTASTEDKMDSARKNGAEIMINYKEEKDLVGKVRMLTGGEGVRVVFDSTGKDQFENDLEVVARKGSVVSYGNSVRAFDFLSIQSAC